MSSESNPSCPSCSSTDTTFKAKAKLWECGDCEERFADPSIQKIAPQSIFLSYAHKNESEEEFDISEDLVWLIKGELDKDGHLVWIDHEGIRGGTQWRERITDAITNHKHFLAFLSKRSVRQEPNVCLNEVAIAIKHNRIIQTILTEPENKVSAPLTLTSIQWHKFDGWKDIKDGKKTGPNNEDWDVWFGDLMTEIRQNLADITHQKAAGELSELKKILKPCTFEAAIINSVEGFFGRRWLFDSIDAWLKTNSRLFWLKGTPGIGKSSFAAKLAHCGNSSIVGFFKCNYQSLKSAEDSANECIRTLAYQLASRLPDYRIQLLRGQQLEQLDLGIKNLQNQERKTPDDLFTYLITEPLNRSEKIAEVTRLALVIDALDEAGRQVNGKMVNPLADLLYKHADQLPSWLGVIVTSRPEAYLQQQLGTKFSPTIMEGGTQNNLSDIKDYLETMLDTAITGEQRDKVIQAIIEKSGGTFLYIKRVENSYDLTKPETLPNGLDDLFYKDFERYFPDRQDFEKHQRPLLEIMVAAQEPLDLEVIKFVLGWDMYGCLQALEPLASLCPIKEGKVCFFHKSVWDWLVDPTLSGAPWHISANLGHHRIADFLDKNIQSLNLMGEYWHGYLLKKGAVHAALAQRPSLGAQLLIAQTANDSPIRLAAGELRSAIDDFFEVIPECTSSALNMISSTSLAALVWRAVTRKSLSFICDLLLKRETEWTDIFKKFPLDGRIATWVFASRWAFSIQESPEQFAYQRWTQVRDIAIDGSHPLFLAASYTFKYVALSRPKWVTDLSIDPIIKSWTYSRLVATNLLLQLTLQGSSFASTLQSSEFWHPVWEYNQTEVDLLAAALQWKGLVSPRTPKLETVELFRSLELKRTTLIESESLSSAGRTALLLFWESGADLERLASCLRVLESSAESTDIFRLYLCSPIFESAEIAAYEVASRAQGLTESAAELIALAHPQADCAWGALVGACKVLLSSGDTNGFFELINRFSYAANAQLRGQAAMTLAAWMRDSDDEVRMTMLMGEHALFKRLLHDEDIWPVQEVFHLLIELSPLLATRKIDWIDFFEANRAPVLSDIKDLQRHDHDWISFEAAATLGREKRLSLKQLNFK